MQHVELCSLQLAPWKPPRERDVAGDGYITSGSPTVEKVK
jgi:hypothetical protein